MEIYQGIKFNIQRIADEFEYDNRLETLHRWIFVLGELGLAPVHSRGAYGNHSYRFTPDSFIITRTGMIPSRDLDQRDYCQVHYAEQEDAFIVKGPFEPSSESFLHFHIYKHFPQMHAVMHGHSSLLNRFAGELNIAQTEEEQPYGTMELALSALKVLGDETPFMILKNHGFVAMGEDINTTAATVLYYYGKLINLLQNRARAK
jgi:ribulose-5-phosphate 4-epimerase/fuculose-1-phosphate aldolase